MILQNSRNTFFMFFAVIVSISVIAFASLDDAAIIVKDSIAVIKDILESKNTKAQKRKKFVSLIDKKVDIEWMSDFILGRNIYNLTKEQLADFRKYYKEFVFDLYYSTLSYLSDKDIKITDIVSKPRDRFYVRGFVLTSDDSDKILFEIRLHKKEGNLLIYDIITSGISLAVSQKSEVISIIENNDIEFLLQKIKTQNDNY